MAEARLAVHPWRVDIFIDQIPGKRVPLSLLGACFFPTQEEAAEWSDRYNNILRTSERVWSTPPVYKADDAEDREKNMLRGTINLIEMENGGFVTND